MYNYVTLKATDHQRAAQADQASLSNHASPSSQASIGVCVAMAIRAKAAACLPAIGGEEFPACTWMEESITSTPLFAQ